MRPQKNITRGGGISPDGTGVATKIGSITRAKTVATERGNHEGASHGPAYGWTDGVVKINNAEIEERIKRDGDKWEQGLIDPFARARYMDRALRLGITAIGRDNVFQGDIPRTLLTSALLKGGWMGWWMLWGHTPQSAFVFDTVVSVIMQGIHHGASLAAHKDNQRGHPLPPRILSLADRKHYDRLALAHVYGASTRLIAAS